MHLEIPPLLKKMDDPYGHTISKSLLAADDSKHWPKFLVLLHWMMELAKNMEEDTESDYGCDGKIRTIVPSSSLRFLLDEIAGFVMIDNPDSAHETADKKII